MLLIEMIENQREILPVALYARRVHVSIFLFLVSTCLQEVGHVSQVRVEQTLLRLWHTIAALLTNAIGPVSKGSAFHDTRVVEMKEEEKDVTQAMRMNLLSSVLGSMMRTKAY